MNGVPYNPPPSYPRLLLRSLKLSNESWLGGGEYKWGWMRLFSGLIFVKMTRDE